MIYRHLCLLWSYYHTLPLKHSKESNVTGPNQLLWIMIALTHLKSTEILSLLWISHYAYVSLNNNAQFEYPLYILNPLVGIQQSSRRRPNRDVTRPSALQHKAKCFLSCAKSWKPHLKSFVSGESDHLPQGDPFIALTAYSTGSRNV